MICEITSLVHNGVNKVKLTTKVRWKAKLKYDYMSYGPYEIVIVWRTYK